MAVQDKLLGPLLIGTFLNVWLFGLMLIQTQTYFQASRKDPTWIKMMVAFLLLADTVNSIFDCVFTYDYAVNKFGDYDSLMVSTWVFNTDPVMTVIISSTVQAFFGWRVKRLTNQAWLAIIIMASAFAQFLCGLGTSIGCGIVKNFTEFQKFKSIVIVWLVLAPVTDAIIAIALVWFLRSHRTGFAATDDIVSKITRLTIQTGAITAVWAALDLAIFLVYPNNLHLILNLPLAKLYGNCLMSSLNARRDWSTSSYENDGRKDIRGINVTTTTGIHRDNYELEVTSNGRPYEGGAQIASVGLPGKTNSTINTATKLPRADDGLSLHSDSIDDEYAASKKAPASEVGPDDRKVDVEWSTAV